MKKIIVLLTTLVLILLFAGCNNSNNDIFQTSAPETIRETRVTGINEFPTSNIDDFTFINDTIIFE